MAAKMFLVLLAACLALARSGALPAAGAEKPPPPPSEDLLQEEITMEGLPTNFPLQRPVNFDLDAMQVPLAHGNHPVQQELVPLGPRGRRPACHSRCPSHIPRANLEEFPPARPSQANIGKICDRGRTKLAYGSWNLPQTGFSHLSRQGQALNLLEKGVGQCCRQNATEQLSCCQGVWSDVLEKFCCWEFSVKTRPHPCCKQTGAPRERCFDTEAPRPDYVFPNSSAKPEGRKVKACADPARCTFDEEKLLLSFPRGEPTEANLENLCNLGRVRQAFATRALPQQAGGSFRLKAESVAQLEKAYEQCCQGQNLSCAHQAWEQALNQFCSTEGRIKTKWHPCCRGPEGDTRYTCFAAQAPYPAYDREEEAVSLADITPSLLDSLCGESVLLTQQRDIPALVQKITDSCCKLQGDARTQCANRQKTQFIASSCSDQRKTWEDTQRCCALAKGSPRQDCFSRHYLSDVSLASAV